MNRIASNLRPICRREAPIAAEPAEVHDPVIEVGELGDPPVERSCLHLSTHTVLKCKRGWDSPPTRAP